MEIEIVFPTDNDGFLEYECPHCKKIFRLNKNLFSDSENFFNLNCPYCGLNAKIPSFYTTECVEYFNLRAEQIAIKELNKSFKSLERNTRGSLIKFKSNPIEVSEPDELRLHSGIEKVVHCLKCSNEYKVDNISLITYCPYCGKIK